MNDDDYIKLELSPDNYHKAGVIYGGLLMERGYQPKPITEMYVELEDAQKLKELLDKEGISYREIARSEW